jgi:transposase InsO family protein
VYLSRMIDWFDGMVVSWSIGTRPDAELVNTMLDAAIETVASSDRPSCTPIVAATTGCLASCPESPMRSWFTHSMSQGVLGKRLGKSY